MTMTPAYVLDRSLCARCSNEGTLKHEGKYEGCPDCPRGREVNRQLAELHTEQAAPEAADPPRWCIVCGADLWDDDEPCDCREEEA